MPAGHGFRTNRPAKILGVHALTVHDAVHNTVQLVTGVHVARDGTGRDKAHSLHEHHESEQRFQYFKGFFHNLGKAGKTF